MTVTVIAAAGRDVCPGKTPITGTLSAYICVAGFGISGSPFSLASFEHFEGQTFLDLPWQLSEDAYHGIPDSESSKGWQICPNRSSVVTAHSPIPAVPPPFAFAHFTHCGIYRHSFG